MDDDRKTLDALKLTGFYSWGMQDIQRSVLAVAQHVEETRAIGSAKLAERYTPEQVRAILDATYEDSCATLAPNHVEFRSRVVRGQFTIPPLEGETTR